MIATLPMYDWPEIRAATDAFWQAIAARMGVRVDLDRTMPHGEPWRRPELIFSQTCGYPFTHEFKDVLTYVATPNYLAEGCDGPFYSSFLLAKPGVRRGDRGLRAAINSMDSMSGMLALKLAWPDYETAVMSGGHVRSLEMVQQGEADYCAVDAVCVALARQHRPWLLDGLVEVTRSPSVPGLPYVTRAADAGELRDILADVFADTSLGDARRMLLLDGVTDLGAAGYQTIITLENSLRR